MLVAPLLFSLAFSLSRPTARTCSPRMSAVVDDLWSTAPAVKVQGNTLKTWELTSPSVERVQVSLRSDGRPIDTDIQLWHTPSYVPTKCRIYSENGMTRPITTIIETPKHPKTVAIYNKAQAEFPFDAIVTNTGLAKPYESLSGAEAEHIQGGRITSYTFGAEVKSIQILLKTVERNMKAKIELTQGPNQTKQIVEMYASSGYKNPFYIIMATPESFSTVRIINENTVEFPFDAYVLPYEYETEDLTKPLMGGGGF